MGNFKIKLTDSRIFKLSLILLVFSLILFFFSIYQLVKTPYSSIYVFLLSNSIFFILGIIFYLKIDIYDEIEGPNKSSINHEKTYKLLKIVFFLNVILLLIILNNSLYTKSYLYYIAIGTLVTILVTQILVKPDTIKDNYFILFFQAIPVALISVGSSYLINPYMIGSDSPWHFHLIQQIVDSGTLSLEAHHYYYFPLYHLIQSINFILLNNSISFELLNLIIFINCIPIVYLIGKEFLNTKVGLISAAIFPVLTTSIFLGLFNSGKIGGTLLILLCSYIIIKRKKVEKFSFNILLLILLIGILLWHPEISFALLIILGADIGSQMLIGKKIDLISFTLFSVLFISYLAYFDTEIFNYIIQSIFINSESPTMVSKIEYIDSPLIIFAQYFWAYIGIITPVFFISFIGLNWLNRLDKVKAFFLCCLCGFVIFFILSLFSGNFGLNPERSLLYYSTITVFIFSYGIYKIFNSSYKNILPLAFLLFIFALASSSSYFTGDGNNFLNDQIPKQTIFTTESNLETYSFLEKTPLGSNISGDYESIRYLGDPIRGFYNLPDREIYDIEQDQIPISGYFLINKPNLLRLSWKNTDYGKKVSARINEINLVYDNGNVTIYY